MAEIAQARSSREPLVQELIAAGATVKGHNASCPFHDDKEASLSVNFQHGGWCCFAGCGRGDMVGFHQRRTGLDFAAAVRDLTGC